jgi:AcrR family transcriptional regulator
MSPKPADPAVRTALLEAAARIIATEGPSRLTLRRLAHEVGASTMAIYTHFGSMTELRRCIRREGFARLGARQAGVATSGDSVADLVVLGWAYYGNATENPNLYRAMFMEGPVDAADAVVGLETFDQLVATVQRCIDAGRFSPADPVHLATQLWAVIHGLVTLELAHLLSEDQVLTCLAAASCNLFQGFGDDPRAIGRSFARARERMVDAPSAAVS